MTTVTHLTAEYRTNPLGIDVTAPRLSWRLQSQSNGARQTAYQVLAASSPDLLTEGKADLWDTGKVVSDQSIQLAYAGQALQSRQRVYWNVTVWDETGSPAQGEPAWFELGLLNASDWQSQWVGAALRGGARSLIPAPYLRKSFVLPAGAASARLYITALGLYEASINGQLVSEDVLTPGWTDYRKRVQYKVYDVTDLLQTGENTLGAILGDGWAVGHLSWNHRQQYVDRPQLLAQLEVTGTDGSTVVFGADNSWKYQFGPVLNNDLLMGEEYDARLEMPGWDQPGFDDQRWYPVEVFENPGVAVVATNGPTVRRMQELLPINPPDVKNTFIAKRFIFDLGQNMVGRVRFKGSAPTGTTITLRFAEVLQPDGSLYTTNLRTARATDYYTFKDDQEAIWEPKFTFHGFRYVELVDYPNEPAEDTITGVVLYSEMAQTGSFECSDEVINQLQRNILWGQKGNFVDVPTDCPQRDERLGWTGDIQVFARTAAFNMDVAGFMTKWAQDVADSQSDAGEIPAVVPKYRSWGLHDGGPAWADAVVICPWTIYQAYDDTRILENNYDNMTRFMDFLLETSPGYIRCAPEYKGWPGFGDWLSINAVTPRDLIGTAFLAYDANLMSKIAALLGKTADAEKYQQLFTDTKAAFAARYLIGSTVSADSDIPSETRAAIEGADAISRGNLKAVDYGPVSTQVFNTNLFAPSQTAYLLALHFDLLPEHLRPLAAAELVADVERRGMHLSAGFVGSSYLADVLSRNGQLDTAYKLLAQKTWPSWLYSVTQGATTIWERWDGWTPENGFQSPEMNSFNHYAYGAIGTWLYNTVAGIDIDPNQPAYKHAVLRPLPGGDLTHASAALDTPYGEIVSSWKLDGGNFEWEMVIPPNTTATIHLPTSGSATLNGEAVTGDAHELAAGKHHVVVAQ